MLLIGDITFPRWNGDAQFDPYITEKQIDDALNHGKSLDAAERTAGANEFLIGNNSDTKVTRELLLKAVDKRRADVVRFMVERGADLNFPTYLLHAAVRRGRYSDAAFVLDLGAAVDVDVPLQGDDTRNRTPLMRAADRACLPHEADGPRRGLPPELQPREVQELRHRVVPGQPRVGRPRAVRV